MWSSFGSIPRIARLTLELFVEPGPERPKQPETTDGNEVLPDCDRYNEECAALRCEYAVQRTRTAGGCERCACVPVDVDCAPLRLECERLRCMYGTQRTTGSDGCERYVGECIQAIIKTKIIADSDSWLKLYT